MPKETSEELAALASKVLKMEHRTTDWIVNYTYNDLLADAKRLAGSVLSQYEADAPATEEKAAKRSFKERAMAAINAVPVKNEEGYRRLASAVVEDKFKALVEVLAETLEGSSNGG